MEKISDMYNRSVSSSIYLIFNDRARFLRYILRIHYRILFQPLSNGKNYMNSIEALQKTFFDIIAQHYFFSPQELNSISFSLNTESEKQAFGDITTNAALVIAKKAGKPPRTIAQELLALLSHTTIEHIDIAGPGFLNITLTQETWITLAQEIFEQKETFFKPLPSEPHERISIEFVSANPTGPLHIGHGRGGIIGDVLGNIFTFLGNNVVKEFYINDAGSQIIKLGLSLKVRCLQQLGIESILPEDAYHGQYLIELAQECVKLYGSILAEKSDNFFQDYAKEHLLKAIKQTLTDYGITFDTWFSEKTLHEQGAIVKSITILQKNNSTYEKEDALWFKSTEYGDDKDRVLRKANGELTYIAADIAYLENKIERHFDRLIMILGQDHHSYVTRLKGILQALGHNPALLDVILYQLVTLKQSDVVVRMSKRAGTMVTLHDIIKLVGKDVARFFYLNRKADAHLDFDVDLALKKTDENPVYYLQYAYVRTKSILEKASQEELLKNSTAQDIVKLDLSDRLVLKKIISLKPLLKAITNHYQIHTLTYYVLELAQLFHSYYAKNRIIDPSLIEQSRIRLVLVQCVHDTLKTCLALLGISCPEKM